MQQHNDYDDTQRHHYAVVHHYMFCTDHIMLCAVSATHLFLTEVKRHAYEFVVM